jgi:hypothetical protein
MNKTDSAAMVRKSARKSINRLYDIRNRFDREYSVEKQHLLQSLCERIVRTAADTKKLHKALCFTRAFPDSPQMHGLASHLLANFDDLIAGLGQKQKDRLVDTGIRSTEIRYGFSFEVAAWLARTHAGHTVIDWAEVEDSSRLDELLQHVLEPAEADYFDSGEVSTEEWLNIAKENQAGTDFDWLMVQLGERRRHVGFWTALYNAADIPLRWTLSDPAMSVSSNALDIDDVFCRKQPMHSRVANAKKQIANPLHSVTRLDRKRGSQLIDVGMASLAVRHRETLHFNYANPDEVYFAAVGRGVHIVVTGLQLDSRYPLECTMGFLILSNGVPIGYGGASILYRQVNTGINIFDEYRGSEAAWLWVQVMRVFHSLTGCNRYIANPYQFGSENSEALQSGAFWFYYRLGYRPVDPSIRHLARLEFAEVRAGEGYRTPLKKLKTLASCDMHLLLPGARTEDFFDEACIETAGLIATRQLAGTGKFSRSRARRQLSRDLANALQIDNLRDWSSAERKWLSYLSPLVSAADPASWTAEERRALVKMLRAKGGAAELDYAREAVNLPRYFSALKKACRVKI